MSRDPDTAHGAAYILIPGAGGMAWYWHRVTELLAQAHRRATAVDLPADDPSAGLEDYADAVVRAMGQRSDVILVAQSLGAFTAARVCARSPVRMLVFVNAMIPQPGETAGAWWEHTQAIEARRAAARHGGYRADFDVHTYFLHDVPPAVLRDGPNPPREQTDTMFGDACQFRDWSGVALRVVASADDRFFPLEFQRRIARERLDMDVHTLAGGHLVALSNPQPLVALLLRFERELADR